MEFSFVGGVPTSSAQFCQALIVQSYGPALELIGQSQSRAYQCMFAALRDLGSGEPVDCGDSPLVLQLMALRAARLEGLHKFTGSKSLFSRPHDDLRKTLAQLGAETKATEDGLEVRSWGWRAMGDAIHLDPHMAGAVILNAWGLAFELHLSVKGLADSRGSLDEVMELVRTFGMRLHGIDPEVSISAQQMVHPRGYEIKPDMGFVFAISAIAALAGEARIKGMSAESLHTPTQIIELLTDMNVPIQIKGDVLVVHQTTLLKAPGLVDLTSSPELLPILSVLAGYAQGETSIVLDSQFAIDESDRIGKILGLLEHLGVSSELQGHTLKIFGILQPRKVQVFEFDSDGDPQLVMAATLAVYREAPIKIIDPQVVEGEFPDFLDLVPIVARRVLN